MHAPLRLQCEFPGLRFRAHVGGKTIIRVIIATAILSGIGNAFAACEEEAAGLCASGDPDCVSGATKWVAQATADCSTPDGRQQHAAMWQATVGFFDGEPLEHVFWRCIAQICDAPR
ncbi:MAG TPA: hypothetical protein VGG24_06870 [Paraburkholderia sp.]|jgi:hypothetical protein